MKEIIENLRNELRTYIKDNNLKTLVLGVSGGIDSAIIAALAKPVCDELNVPILGRFIEIDSNKPDERKRADKIGKHFISHYNWVKLDREYEEFKDIDSKEIDGYGLNIDILDDFKRKIRKGNIKARMRMIYLYNVASKYQGIVLSTDNYTEYLLGFFTIFGDQGDLGLIQNLWKTEVYDIAEYLVDEFAAKREFKKAKALNDCIDANATDGLGITNSDLDQIMPDWKERHSNSREGYKEVDDYIKNYLKIKKLKSQGKRVDYKKHKIYNRIKNTEFKRNHPFNVPRSNIVK